MKKIGLITLYQNNYGSVLQCYATKKYLEEKGYIVEVLYLSNNYTEKLLHKLKKLLTLATVFSLTLTGCSSKNELQQISNGNEDISITLVLDRGGVNDQSFNESAWSGAQAAAKEFGVSMVQAVKQASEDYRQGKL